MQSQLQMLEILIILGNYNLKSFMSNRMHESSDDSLTVIVNRGRGLSDALRENDSLPRLSTSGRPQTPPRTAPSSPLKMNWNPDQSSIVTTPERHYGYSEHLLGLSGDVILPDVPISVKDREISGASNFSDQNTMSGSVESLGMQTWRSVDGLSALADGGEEKSRSRGVSDDS